MRITLSGKEIVIAGSSVSWVLYGHFEKTPCPVPPLSQQILERLNESLIRSWRQVMARFPDDTNGYWSAFGAKEDVDITDDNLHTLMKCVKSVSAELEGDPIEMKTVLNCTKEDLANLLMKLGAWGGTEIEGHNTSFDELG